jgi:hypothetical protein
MRILLLLCGGLLAACGDVGSGPGTGPVDPAVAADGCNRDCQHRIECGSTQTLADCTAQCITDTSWVRADAFEDVIACTSTRACTGSTNDCLSACVPTDAHERFEAQCRATLAACGSADEINGFCETTPDPAASGDVGLLCLATPAIMDELTACLATGTACADANTCIQGVLAAHGIDG